MARTNDTRLELHAPLSVVEEVMLDEAFNRARDEAQGTFNLRVTVLSETDAEVVYRVDGTQYARGLRGVDTSRTEDAATTYTWDRTTHSATWTYAGPHGDRVQVSGTIRLTEARGRTVVDETLVVDIQIPLVGGQIEKLVLKEMKQGFATYERVLREHVAAASASVEA